MTGVVLTILFRIIELLFESNVILIAFLTFITIFLFASVCFTCRFISFYQS